MTYDIKIQTTIGFSGGICVRGKLYMVSSWSMGRIWVINTATDQCKMIDVGAQTSSGDNGPSSNGTLAKDGNIYFPPYKRDSTRTFNKISVIDTKNDSVYYIDTPNNTASYNVCIEGADGLLYFPPAHIGSGTYPPVFTNKTLVLNPATREVKEIGDVIGRSWFTGVLAFNGNIYGIPVNVADRVLVINGNKSYFIPEKPPVEPPIDPPIEPPVDPPVEPPIDPPVDPPTEPPVEPPPEEPSKYFTLTPESASVARGGTLQFVLSSYPQNLTANVAWSVSGNSRVGTTVSSNGLLTIAGNEKKGDVLTITAVSKINSAFSAVSRITMT